MSPGCREQGWACPGPPPWPRPRSTLATAPSAARISMRAAEGRPGGGGRQWDRRAGLIVGRARLRGGPSARCQCITCSSGPSPGQRGVGGLRSVCVSVPAVAAGAGRSSVAPGRAGRVRWAEGPRDHSGRLSSSPLPSPPTPPPPGFAKVPEPFSLAEVAGVPSRDQTAKIQPFEPTQRPRTVTLRLPGASWAVSQELRLQPPAGKLPLPTRSLGAPLSTVPRAPQSPGNHNGVRGRPFPALVT